MRYGCIVHHLDHWEFLSRFGAGRIESCQKESRAMNVVRIIAALSVTFQTSAAFTQSSDLEVMLSCSGTVAVVADGRQTNPIGEKSSHSIAINLARGTFKVDDSNGWQITSGTLGDIIVAIANNVGSATLNRVSGAASIHLLGSDGLRVFSGKCENVRRLF